MWRTARPAALKALAVRTPVPSIMIAAALPAAQPGRLTISCTIAARFGVRCATPAAPIGVQPGGDQATVVVVSARDVTLKAAVVNVAALSDA